MWPKHWRIERFAAGLALRPVLELSLGGVAVISALVPIWLSLVDASVSQVLEAQLAFTSQRFVDAIGPLGPDGISELVRVTITLDFVLPLAYATALGASWARLVDRREWTQGVAILGAAFSAAAADWIENLFHLGAAAQMVEGSRPSQLLVLAGSVFASVKWALLLTSMLVIARVAVRRRGRVALAIPLTLAAGSFAAAILAAAL